MSKLLETMKFDRKRVASLLARIAKLQGQEGYEDIADMPNDSDKDVSMEEENENRNTSNITSATIFSRNSCDTISAARSPVYTNASLKDISVTSWAISNASNYIDFSGKPLESQTAMSNIGNNSFKLNSPLERHVSFSCSSDSFYSFTPSSVVTRNPLNELERRLSTTSILKFDFVEQKASLNCNEDMSCSNVPSLQLTSTVSGKTASSLFFTDEIPSTQLLISPSKSATALYEYCLSDIDFEPSGMSRASIFSNDQLIDKNR